MNNLVVNTCSFDKLLIYANKTISIQQKKIMALTGLGIFLGIYSVKNTIKYKKEIYALKEEIEKLKNAGENDEV